MKRHQFTKSYTNRDKLPFDAPGLALALKYLYDKFVAKPDRPALPIHTQIPDFPEPQNPVLHREPSQAPLGAPKPIPKQALHEKDRTIATLKEKLEKKEEELEKLEHEAVVSVAVVNLQRRMEMSEWKHARLLKNMRKAYTELMHKKLISPEARDDLV